MVGRYGRHNRVSRCNLESLVLKHTEEITELQKASSNMMLLWRIVGAVALVMLGAWLTGQSGAA